MTDTLCWIPNWSVAVNLTTRPPLRTRPGILATSALALLLCVACAPHAPIVIGFAASLSGKDYMLGVEGRNAAELFVRTANAAREPQDRRLVLEVRDLRSDDATVAAVTRELTQAGAGVIVGYYTSSSAVAALAVPPNKRAVLVSPSATSAVLSGHKDGFYRTIMSSEQDVPILVADMRRRGIQRVLFLATSGNAAYVDTYASPLKTQTAVQADIRFNTPGDIDYDYIRQLFRQGPEAAYQAVVIVASSIDTGTIAQELAVRGLSAPLYVSGWAGTDDLLTYGGSAVDGAVFAHQTDPDHPGWAEVAALYQAAFHTKPGFSALQTWDALLFVQTALQAAGNQPKKVAGALQSIRSFSTPTGSVSMDEYGDAHRNVYIKRVTGPRIIIQKRDD